MSLTLAGATLIGGLATGSTSLLSSLFSSSKNYQLQKEALEYQKYIDSENLALSQRQQDLSEESYYNGVINEASQLQTLGINPAAYGGTLSGSTMQGGSQVNSKAQAPQFNGVDFSTLISALNTSADIKLKEAQADNLNANTALTDAKAGTEKLTQSEIKARIDSIETQTDYTSLMKEVYEQNEKWFNDVLGVSSETFKSMQNVDYRVLVMFGVTNLLSQAVGDDKASDDAINGLGEVSALTKTAQYKKDAQAVVESIETYENLSEYQQQKVLDTAIALEKTGDTESLERNITDAEIKKLSKEWGMSEPQVRKLFSGVLQ